MVQIDYDSEGFPPSVPVVNRPAVLYTSWNDILWAALTVGRPNIGSVFQHGDASLYEALFRLSLVRLALEQSGSRAWRLRRTDAARALDPSEKGAINYFIGMALCTLFADQLLDAPWMLHVDLLRPALNRMLSGRSRPDLFGQRTSGEWVVMESKGRISAPDATAKTKAKQQAQRFPPVVGPIQFRIGGIAYLKNDVLQFYWRDPPPEDEGQRTSIPLDPALWRYHYVLPFAMIQAAERAPILRAADVTVSAHPVVLGFLRQSQWAAAKIWCVGNGSQLTEDGFRKDGLKVTAGRSWAEPFKERFAAD